MIYIWSQKKKTRERERDTHTQYSLKLESQSEVGSLFWSKNLGWDAQKDLKVSLPFLELK